MVHNQFQSIYATALLRNQIYYAVHIWIQFMHHGETRLHYHKTCYGVILRGENMEHIILASLCVSHHSHAHVIFSVCSVIVQVLCSYCTIPLYALVTQVR